MVETNNNTLKEEKSLNSSSLESEIKPYIVLHQNKKIDVLSTFWNIPNPLRDNFFRGLNINPSPFHILNNTKLIREVLK